MVLRLGSGIIAALRVMTGANGHGSISVNMGDGAFTANVVGDGVHWAGSASVMSIALWLCGPPLLLWLLWLVTRHAPTPAREPERDYRVS